MDDNLIDADYVNNRSDDDDDDEDYIGRELKYKCPSCYKSFNSIKACRSHATIVHKRKIYQCPHCHKIYITKSGYFVHKTKGECEGTSRYVQGNSHRKKFKIKVSVNAMIKTNPIKATNTEKILKYMREELQEKIQDESLNKLEDESRCETQYESSEESRDESQEEPRDESSEESLDESSDESSEESSEESSDESSEESRYEPLYGTFEEREYQYQAQHYAKFLRNQHKATIKNIKQTAKQYRIKSKLLNL